MKIKTWQRWTPAEDEQLEALRLDGLEVDEIASHMSRTVPSIKERLKALEIRKPLWRAMEWARLFQLGHTLREVAGMMQVSYRSAIQAKYRLRRAGFSFVN